MRLLSWVGTGSTSGLGFSGVRSPPLGGGPCPALLVQGEDDMAPPSRPSPKAPELDPLSKNTVRFNHSFRETWGSSTPLTLIRTICYYLIQHPGKDRGEKACRKVRTGTGLRAQRTRRRGPFSGSIRAMDLDE
jgi:hypothetical protein